MAHTLDGQGDRQGAVSCYQQAVTLFQETGDLWALTIALIREQVAAFRQLHSLEGGVAMGLHYLTFMAAHLGDWATATAAAQEKAEIEALWGTPLDRAYGLHSVSLVHLAQGHLDQARALLEEAWALAGDSLNQDFVAELLCCLGQVALYTDRVDESAELLHAARHLSGRPLPSWLDGRTLFFQGQVAARQGQYQEALALMQACLAKRQDDLPQLPMHLEGLAAVWLGLGEPERAVILLGAADSLRQAMGCPVLPVDQPRYEQTLAEARASVGSDVWAAGWTTGEGMSANKSVVFAMEGIGNPGHSSMRN
jgi:tetratricopeptide (TPR) repeat protein